MTAVAVTQMQTQPEADAVLDAEVDDVIAAFGGDAHLAVRALVTLAFRQEQQITELREAVSHGLHRGRLLRRSPVPDHNSSQTTSDGPGAVQYILLDRQRTPRS